MASRFEQEVRRTLSRYLAGDVGLQDLQTWLAPRAWDLDPLEDPSAYQLVGRIELILAEASSGHWTEDEVRERFGPYAKVVEFAHAPAVNRKTISLL